MYPTLTAMGTAGAGQNSSPTRPT
ncbi:uncharacterized protein METZ01_LOCUS269500 [marine metagenome]|uniref:Uncharacterized protein n=1 Tax=marine metagenome TaxID=408172 RepID=A0A382JY57_9ZZZZ